MARRFKAGDRVVVTAWPSYGDLPGTVQGFAQKEPRFSPDYWVRLDNIPPGLAFLGDSEDAHRFTVAHDDLRRE